MNQFRRISQAVGVLLGNGYLKVLSTGSIYRGPLKGVCVPFLNCYACPLDIFSCPVGSLQHFMTIRTLPVMLMGILGLVGASVGRMACGWLCPFGLIQELFYKIPSRKIRLAQSLRYGKYLTLVLLVLALPLISGVPWFSKLCPQGTLTAGLPWVLINPVNPQTGHPAVAAGELGILFAVKLLILGGFLVLFVVSKRPFCRIACPLGAIFSLFNRFSMVRLRVSEKCRGCRRCREACPVDHQVSQNPDAGECIRCLKCTSCKNVAVEIRTFGRGLKPAVVERRENG